MKIWKKTVFFYRAKINLKYLIHSDKSALFLVSTEHKEKALERGHICPAICLVGLQTCMYSMSNQLLVRITRTYDQPAACKDYLHV
jgi:hypothetical protein